MVQSLVSTVSSNGSGKAVGMFGVVQFRLNPPFHWVLTEAGFGSRNRREAFDGNLKSQQEQNLKDIVWRKFYKTEKQNLSSRWLEK